MLDSQLSGKDYSTREVIIQNFVQQRNPSRQEIINELTVLKNENDKYTAALSWLEKPERNAEDFYVVVLFFTNEKDKFNLAVRWLKKEGISRENFVAVLPVITGENNQEYLASGWLAEEVRSKEDFDVVFSLFTDKDAKLNLASSWLRKKGISRENFVTVLPLITMECLKEDFAVKWLTEEVRSKEDFDIVFSLFNQQAKPKLSLRWLKQQNPETTYQAFLEFASNDIYSSRYNAEEIVKAYSTIPTLTNKITDLCKDLYPNNELMQFELFAEYVKKTSSQQLTPNIESLKSFIQNLTNDDFALQSLDKLKTKINIPPLEILEIAKGRFGEKYNSIKDILGSKTKEEVFNESAVAVLAEEFGRESTLQVAEASLCDIFSYYDLNNKLGEFRSILKDGFIQELTENFSPSDKSPYISKKEFDKMSFLVDGLDLPKVSVLGGYLNGVVAPKISEAELTEEKINNFKFGDSLVLVANVGNQSSVGDIESKGEEESKEDLPSQKQLEEFTEKFKRLLRDPNPTVEDVANFFAQGLDLQDKLGFTNQDSSKKQEDQQKLTDFFGDNKSLVALLFAQEGGFDKFELVFRGIADGCVANIATQFKSAVYKPLLHDFELVALFSVFNEKISTPILNSGGDHLTGSSTGIDIFTDHFIVDNYVSPNGLIKALAKEFYNSDLEKKQLESTEEIITKVLVREYGEKLGKEKYQELMYEVLDKHPDKIDQKLAEIAAYYVLKLTVPALLENRYLSDIKELAELDSAPATSVISQDQSPLSARAAGSNVIGG